MERNNRMVYGWWKTAESTTRCSERNESAGVILTSNLLPTHDSGMSISFCVVSSGRTIIPPLKSVVEFYVDVVKFSSCTGLASCNSFYVAFSLLNTFNCGSHAMCPLNFNFSYSQSLKS